MSDLETDLLDHYRALHDGLSDMIEGGRMKAIPADDYKWLVEMLVEAVSLDHHARAEIAEENDEPAPYISPVAPDYKRREDGEECQHEWKHDEAYDEFVCVHCEARKD